MSITLLVTGAGGLVGGRLAEILAGAGRRVVGAVHLAAAPPDVETVPLELEAPAGFTHAFERVRPDVVIHAAALADADRCQREPERADRLNVEAPARIARTCRARGARLIALSTDLVFEGTRSSWSEADPARPLLHYGRTKLLGEAALLAEDPGATVLRVALVAGRTHGRPSASESIAWSLRAGRRPRLYSDQYRTPIDPESIADAIKRLLDRELPGRLHLGGSERLSRHQLGLRVARALGLPSDAIDAVRYADQPLPATRPADVSLDSTRARRELGWEPRALDAAIRAGRPGPL